MGAVAALSLIPTVWAARTEGMQPIERAAHRSFGESIKEFARPLHEGDFAWVIFTRLMVSSGITVVLYFLVNFFKDVVLAPTTSAAAGSFTSNWELVVVATALPFGFFGGQLSDRIARRKIFVYLYGAAQSFVALAFLLFYPRSIPLVFALGVAYGLGYRLDFAVDLALAAGPLAEKTEAANDQGDF